MTEDATRAPRTTTVAARPGDEGRHPPGPEQFWNESWYLDWTNEAGTLGGYVRLGLYPNLTPERGAAWYWACVVGEGRPLSGPYFNNHSCSLALWNFQVRLGPAITFR